MNSSMVSSVEIAKSAESSESSGTTEQKVFPFDTSASLPPLPPLNLPLEINYKIIFQYLDDRLNFLKTINSSFLNFIKEFNNNLSTVSTVTDETIYLESINLKKFAQYNKIIINEKQKIECLSRGKKLSYDLLYPFNENIIIKLIQTDLIEYDDILSKLLNNWPFSKFHNRITMSFVFESSDQVFEKVINSQQIAHMVFNDSYSPIMFDVEKIKRFQNKFPGNLLRVDTIRFQFPSNFSYVDIVASGINFEVLRQIDFDEFVHYEKDLVHIFKNRSISHLQSYHNLMPNDPLIHYCFSKTCSQLAAIFKWFEPFAPSAKLDKKIEFNVLKCCPLTVSDIATLTQLDVFLNTHSLSRHIDSSALASIVHLCAAFNYLGSSFLDHKVSNFKILIQNVYLNNPNQMNQFHVFCRKNFPYFVLPNEAPKSSVDQDLYYWRVYQLFYNFYSLVSNHQHIVYQSNVKQFIESLDDIFQSENSFEVQAMREVVLSIIKLVSPPSFQEMNFSNLQHSKLLPVFASVWPLVELSDLNIIFEVIDENVVDYLIYKYETIKASFIYKIDSPKTLIKAFDQDVLSMTDVGPTLVEFTRLTMKWDRIDLCSIFWTKPNVKSWLQSFTFVFFSTVFGSEIDQVSNHYYSELVKIFSVEAD